MGQKILEFFMSLIHFFEIKKETVLGMCDESNPIKIIELLGLDILSVIIIPQRIPLDYLNVMIKLDTTQSISQLC